LLVIQEGKKVTK